MDESLREITSVIVLSALQFMGCACWAGTVALPMQVVSYERWTRDHERYRVDCAAVHGICLMGCGRGLAGAGCLVCALDESYGQGLSSLACCSRQKQSNGEVMRRAAKNTEGLTDSLWVVARPSAEEHFYSANCFGDKRQRVLVITGLSCPCSGREMSTKVAKCIQMYTYVAPISVFLGAFLRLTEQFLAVPDGFREDELGAFHSVSVDGFHLQVFFGREQWLFSSCASNVHKAGPPRALFRFRQPFEALSEFDAIVLGQVDLSRPKST